VPVTMIFDTPKKPFSIFGQPLLANKETLFLTAHQRLICTGNYD
jgi:hypothetical protein